MIPWSARCASRLRFFVTPSSWVVPQAAVAGPRLRLARCSAVEIRLTRGPSVLAYTFDARAPYRLLGFAREDGTAYRLAKCERIAYWLSVGALPSENCEVLIKKYGKDGTHLPQQQAALEKIKTTRPQAPAPYIPPPKPPEPEPAAEAPAAEAAPAEAPAEEPKSE